jgi:hypothetical protein
MDIYLLTDSLNLNAAGQKIKDNNEGISSLKPVVKPVKPNPNVAVSNLNGTDHTLHKQVFYDEIK